jgi:hypothetical protein
MWFESQIGGLQMFFKHQKQRNKEKRRKRKRTNAILSQCF